MTDRELLELAAKAVGIVTLPHLQPDGTSSLRVFGGFWNPLADDGAALRLAVKLKMTVHCNGEDVFVTEGVTEWLSFDENSKKDPMAAARRAIVRAAAAIGKGLA